MFLGFLKIHLVEKWDSYFEIQGVLLYGLIIGVLTESEVGGGFISFTSMMSSHKLRNRKIKRN